MNSPVLIGLALYLCACVSQVRHRWTAHILPMSLSPLISLSCLTELGLQQPTKIRHAPHRHFGVSGELSPTEPVIMLSESQQAHVRIIFVKLESYVQEMLMDSCQFVSNNMSEKGLDYRNFWMQYSNSLFCKNSHHINITCQYFEIIVRNIVALWTGESAWVSFSL